MQEPLMALEAAKKTFGQKNFALALKFRTLQVFKILFPKEREGELNMIAGLLLAAQSSPSPDTLYAFQHRPGSSDDPGWLLYQPKREFARMGLPSESWRLTNLNSDYSVAPAYPALLAVPYQVPLDTLVLASRFRKRGRLPVLTWKVSMS